MPDAIPLSLPLSQTILSIPSKLRNKNQTVVDSLNTLLNLSVQSINGQR